MPREAIDIEARDVLETPDAHSSSSYSVESSLTLCIDGAIELVAFALSIVVDGLQLASRRV